jgi:hypothetical protein
MKFSTILILAILGMFFVINVIDAKKHKEEKERDDDDDEDHEDKEVKRNNPDLCKRRENCHECLEVRSSSYSCTWLQSKNSTLIADKCVNSIVAENELTTVLFEVFNTGCKKDKPKKKHAKKMATTAAPSTSPSSPPIG